MPWDTRDADTKDRRLMHAIIDMRAPMAEAEGVIVDAIERNFATESAAGEPWAPLAKSTIEDRERHGYSAGPILTRSRDLRGSMKSSSGIDFSQAGPSEDIAYAGVHEDGSLDGRIPARPYLRLAAQDEDKIEDAILRHLESNE